MPRKIQNAELYADRTVQDWHREMFPHDWWAIDLDLMGCCARCRQPEYLIESTTNPNKPTSVLTNLAERASVPGLVIRHREGAVIGGKTLWPFREPLTDQAAVIDHLTFIRSSHICTPRRL